ncbi:MAG: PAS domain S-box protein [Chloroflexi bacterium]|nr:PAS domain S-box protein [Chloroflexota bacterium]
MRIRKERHSRDNSKINNQTRDVLDTAITSLVQAIGSKAGVLIFWDEKRNAPGHASPYGLTTAMYEDLRPLIEDLVVRLNQGEPFRPNDPAESEQNEELPALKVDVPTLQGPLQVIALPINAEGRFIAALCLLQPATQPAPFLPVADKPALPPGSAMGIGPRTVEEEDSLPLPSPYNLTIDQDGMVTRNARLLRQLVQEKEWLKSIIDYSADGILIVDKDCTIMGFNPAFARLTGWAVEELRGQNCYEALKFQPREGSLGNEQCGANCPIKLGTYVNRPDLECRSEVVLVTKDGEKRDVELTYSVILSSHRDILGGIIGARDVTARKEAEELQSTFLSVISHELQTPIAIIKGYAGLFADTNIELKPEQVREKMHIIQEESERLSKLVDNLLYASRLQAGGVELGRAPVDLQGLIKRVVQKMKGVSKQHSLQARLPEELPAVLADYDKIQQVLVNLIENAIKYSPKGGLILIEANPNSTEVVVSVTDQGIGVPKSERQRIFDRFSRLDSRYVRERKGAGLGLYICKAIIEAHGGRIWVEPVLDTGGRSDNMNGSRFNFSLPREEPAALPVLFGKI